MSINRKVVLLSAVLRLMAVWVSAFVDELDDIFLETRAVDDIWLINFYAPWCLLCKQLDPEWHQIGSELRSSGSPVYVGKTDATVNTGLAKEFGVRSYPSILMLKKDLKYKYSGPRSKDGILDFAHRVSGPLVRVLSSLRLFQHAMSHHNVLFVYVGAKSALQGNYLAAAEELIVHTYFFSASRDVLPKTVSLSSLPAVVVFKDGTYSTYNEESDGELKSWIKRERFPNYLKIDSYSLYAMGESGKLVVLALVEKNPPKESLKCASLVEKVSVDYKDFYSRHFHFGFMDEKDYINGLVMGEVDVPSVIVLNLSNDGYFLPLGDIETEHHLVDFLNGVLDGVIQCQGGNSIIQRLRRLLYDIRITLTLAPVLGCFLLGLVLSIATIFFYVCWKSMAAATDDVPSTRLQRRQRHKNLTEKKTD